MSKQCWFLIPLRGTQTHFPHGEMGPCNVCLENRKNFCPSWGRKGFFFSSPCPWFSLALQNLSAVNQKSRIEGTLILFGRQLSKTTLLFAISRSSVRTRSSRRSQDCLVALVITTVHLRKNDMLYLCKYGNNSGNPSVNKQGQVSKVSQGWLASE